MTFATTEPSVSFSSTTSNTPNRRETTSQEQKFHEKIQPNSGLPANAHLLNDQESPEPKNKLLRINHTFKR